MNRLPRFFVVGVSKCGTTAIHDYLSLHPNICLPAMKEPYFMWFHNYSPTYRNHQGTTEPETWRYLPKTLNDYESLFDVQEETQVIGECTPDYYYFDHALQNILKFTKSPKIIICLRDPINRAFSAFQMRRSDVAEPIGSFLRAVEIENQRIFEGWHFAYHYINQARYTDRVKKLFELFGRENVKVLLHNDLRRDSRMVVRDICEFVGVDPEQLPNEEINSNEGRAPYSYAVQQLLYEESMVRRVMKTVVPPTLRVRIRRSIHRANQSVVRVSRSEREALLPLVIDDVCRLENLIGRDLSHWKSADGN